jgi:hypothetical protein
MINAIGKWNKDELYWEVTDGAVSLCAVDRDLRLVASQNQDYPLNINSHDVVRQRDVDAYWKGMFGGSNG